MRLTGARSHVCAGATDKDWEAFDQHQSDAARLDFAEEARTLLDIARYQFVYLHIGAMLGDSRSRWQRPFHLAASHAEANSHMIRGAVKIMSTCYFHHA